MRISRISVKFEALVIMIKEKNSNLPVPVCSVPGLPPMSLSILSIRSSIAFASCTSWTNFKEDLSTSKGKVVHTVYACAKLPNWEEEHYGWKER